MAELFAVCISSSVCESMNNVDLKWQKAKVSLLSLAYLVQSLSSASSSLHFSLQLHFFPYSLHVQCVSMLAVSQTLQTFLEWPIFWSTVRETITPSHITPSHTHTLTHTVVFMGSKKYPGENTFDVFTKRHGGFSNASTDYEMVGTSNSASVLRLWAS